LLPAMWASCASLLLCCGVHQHIASTENLLGALNLLQAAFQLVFASHLQTHIAMHTLQVHATRCWWPPCCQHVQTTPP
jgi:hypothetical protein